MLPRHLTLPPRILVGHLLGCQEPLPGNLDTEEVICSSELSRKLRNEEAILGRCRHRNSLAVGRQFISSCE